MRLDVVGDLAGSGARVREVDDVLVVSNATLGDPVARLVFRVGVVDEPFHLRGITHLIEHVVLDRFERSSLQVNGTTGPTSTEFVGVGPMDRLANFVNGVVAGLARDATDEEVAGAAAVLRAEGQLVDETPLDHLVVHRFGVSPYAMPAFREYFLEAPRVEVIREWIAGWFTRANATLVIHGEVPDGLDLSALAPGAYRPPPAVPPARHGTGWYFPGCPWVVGFGVVPRGVEMGAAVAMLDQRLSDRLREDEGMSYAPETDYHPVTGDLAVVQFGADVVEDRADDAASVVVDEIDRLAVDGPDEDTLNRYVIEFAETRHLLGAREAMFEGVAQDVILRREILAPDALEEHIRALDVAAVRRAARDLRDAVSLAGPSEEAPDVGWLTGWEDTPGATIRGRRVTGIQRDTTFVIGEGVVSLEEPQLVTTIGEDHVVGRVVFDDGALWLVDEEGNFMGVQPAHWDDPEAVRRALTDLAPDVTSCRGGLAMRHPRLGQDHQRGVFGAVMARRRATVRAAGGYATLVDAMEASWDPDWRDDLPAARAFVMGGMIVTWYADRGMLADWVEDAATEALDRYRRGASRPTALFQALDGLLTSAMLTPDGQDIALHMHRTTLGLGPTPAEKAWQRAFPDTTSVYDVRDAADNVATLHDQYTKYARRSHRLRASGRQTDLTATPMAPAARQTVASPAQE